MLLGQPKRLFPWHTFKLSLVFCEHRNSPNFSWIGIFGRLGTFFIVISAHFASEWCVSPICPLLFLFHAYGEPFVQLFLSKTNTFQALSGSNQPQLDNEYPRYALSLHGPELQPDTHSYIRIFDLEKMVQSFRDNNFVLKTRYFRYEGLDSQSFI